MWLGIFQTDHTLIIGIKNISASDIVKVYLKKWWCQLTFDSRWQGQYGHLPTVLLLNGLKERIKYKLPIT